MKFKIFLRKKPVHKGPATCVGWCNTEEVYSCGDDNQLFRWNANLNEATKLIDFETAIYPIDLQWMPRGLSFSKHNDIILLTGADGRFHILSRNGRIEKSIEAHNGAILVGRWSNDGAGLLTAGEDGLLKIWSKGGMLRSTIVTSESPIYSAAWSQDSQSILYTQGKLLIIKQLAPNTKPIRWRAHDGLVLCVAWSITINVIVSGGEDCKYKVWDPQGRLMFSSSSHDYPITVVSWAPHGDLFAVGAYNTLRLCDASGWSHCLEKIDIGSLYCISWSSDGTQLCAACAGGDVLFGYIINRQFNWRNLIVCIRDKKSLSIKDVLIPSQEIIDYTERIIKVAVGYGHLVLTTSIQCYCYTVSNWSLPEVIDLKEGYVSHILLSEKYFALVERSSINIYSYHGRMIAAPKWPSMNTEILNKMQITLSADCFIVCDQNDPKNLYLFELGANRTIQDSAISIQHNCPIIQVALNQAGFSSDRFAGIVDENKDLFIIPIRGRNRPFNKIGSQVQCIRWNSDYNILAAIQDVRLVVWYTPNAGVFSQQLLRMAALHYENADLGRSPHVVDFTGTSVFIRRSDGSLLSVPIASSSLVLHDYASRNKWELAINLCRLMQDFVLWSCLAVLATQSKSVPITAIEEAYAAINQPDKVLYVQYIKSLKNKSLQAACTAVLAGSILEAETILLHNGLIYYAIIINIQMHNWNKALEMAMKHKAHIDIVLYARKKYLESIDKIETNTNFLNMQDWVIDENSITDNLTLDQLKD